MSGEMTHYTDPTTGIVWHNGKFVEQLKQQLQLKKDNIAELNELLISYKGENEKLEQYKKSKQTSYEKLQDRCNKLEWENRELKQKLEKIKDICKPLLEVTTIDRLFGAEHTAEYYLAQDILQIIGE